MTEVIGPFTIGGTPDQIAAIRDMAKKLGDALGDRLKDVTVAFRPGEQLRKKGHVTAFTPRGLTPNGHRILMHERIDKYDPDRTFAHEVMHALDFQWFTDEQRLDIAKLMDPMAKEWDAREYSDRAYEAYACYASAALGGFKWPVYTEFYDKSVPKTQWSTLAATALKDYGPVTPAPDPDPTPSDEIVDLKAQLAKCQAELAAMTAERDALKVALAAETARMLAAKANAQATLDL